MRLVFTLFLIVFCSPLVGQKEVIKSKIITKSNFQGKTVSVIEETYNESGQLIEQVNYAKKERTSIRKYKYDSIGLLAIETRFSKFKEIQEELAYDYNDKGLLVKKEKYYPLTNRTQVEKIVRNYNEDGSLQFEIVLDNDSSQIWVYQFDYDLEGDIRSKKSTHKGELKNESVYIFKQGQIVEEKLFAFDNPSREAEEDSQIYYDYNESGYLVKKTIMSLAELLARPLLMEEDILYNKHGYISKIKKSNNGKLYSEMNFDYTFY
ncbi:MAG: hypothetical protein ACI8XB_000916 [Patiriisocius sp.]|jgi:hypothetical protein